MSSGTHIQDIPVRNSENIRKWCEEAMSRAHREPQKVDSRVRIQCFWPRPLRSPMLSSVPGPDRFGLLWFPVWSRDSQQRNKPTNQQINEKTNERITNEPTNSSNKPANQRIFLRFVCSLRRLFAFVLALFREVRSFLRLFACSIVRALRSYINSRIWHIFHVISRNKP